MARRTGYFLTSFAGYWLLIAAFWTLICARGFRVPPAGHMRQALGLEWQLQLALETHLLLFAALCIAMVAGWLVAAQAMARSSMGIGAVLTGTTLLAVPFILLTGIYSDDVYLYNLYGRELAIHGANPLLVPPSEFSDDPHLKWVYWKWLPSAYGPLWLLVSAPLSALAGGSITAVVILYRIAGLALHVGASWLMWRTLGGADSPRAASTTAFFAWNPFVLFEVVASAHNEALVAVAICAAVFAWNRGRWTVSGAAIGCAVMVKLFAGLLMLPLLAAAAAGPRNGIRLRVLGAIAAGAAIAGAVLYLPFRAGDALVANAVSNPAAGVYMNTLWEFAAIEISAAYALSRPWLEGAVLTPLRFSIFGLIVLGAVALAVRRRAFVFSALVLWIGLCLTLSWVWPWYFVPAIVLAAFAGDRARPMAAALTLGGLLFYLSWPPPEKQLGWIYEWRSVFLFGPLLVVLLLDPQLRSGKRPLVNELRDPLAG